MSRRRPGLPERDGRVQCLHCDGWYRSLGPHLRWAGITAAEYRAEHRLPATTALMASGTRASLSEARTTLMGQDPSVVERMRAATPAQGVLASRAAAGRAGTDQLPAVQAARAAGARRTQPAAAQARRDAALARAGVATIEEAVTAVAGLSHREAGRVLGVASSTVARWRRTV